MGNPVLLWVLRGVDGDVGCAFEQIAEGHFELTVSGPHGLLACETFTETASLLTRAVQLRADVRGRLPAAAMAGAAETTA
jgi:hypothetical protein